MSSKIRDMNNDKFNRLVEKAKQLNIYSEKYAQSQLWASRDSDTSIIDIEMAVNVARNNIRKAEDKKILYSLSNDSEFLSAERDLKIAVSKLVDAQIKITQRYNADAAQSNRILEIMTTKIKEILFTEKKFKEFC